jgi:hypothetical protein
MTDIKRPRELTKRVYVSFSESEYEALTTEIIKTSASNGVRSLSAIVRELTIKGLVSNN